MNRFLPVYVYIKNGSTLREITQKLQTSGVIHHKDYFLAEVLLHNSSGKLKKGEYLFAPQSTPKDIYHQISSGKVIHYSITLVAGWSFSQVKMVLISQPLLLHDLDQQTNRQIAQYFSPKLSSPEGIFAPNTYFYVRGSKESQLLQRAYRQMDQYLSNIWQSRQIDLPYQTPYEALIAASLIEKETAKESEKQLVASVIVNRLRKGMRLQIDPTVIYGLGTNYQGKITRADLRHRSPYNTYVNSGLPPTPITLPSLSSVYAALNPASTDYLYFVAKDDKSHQFSKTLTEQNAAVKKYILNKKA